MLETFLDITKNLKFQLIRLIVSSHPVLTLQCLDWIVPICLEQNNLLALNVKRTVDKTLDGQIHFKYHLLLSL